MNDWNQWEQQLSGWAPRRPSPKVKRRLFPSAPAAKQEMPWVISWHWFAVASSFALLAVMVWSRLYFGPGHPLASGYNSLVANLSLSNQNFASYYSPHRHSSRNAW